MSHDTDPRAVILPLSTFLHLSTGSYILLFPNFPKMTTSIDEIDYMGSMLNQLCPPSPTSQHESCPILAFTAVSRDGIEEALFHSDIMEEVCDRCCDLNFPLRHPGQGLVFLCHFIPPERYCLSIDKVLVLLLERIPVEGLLENSHSEGFKNSCSEVSERLERQATNLDLLERYIFESPAPFREAIQERFWLLQVTLEVYHWRHETTRSVVFGCDSLLSPHDRFSSFVSIQSDEMDMLRDEFMGQMRNMRHEMKLYKGRYGYRGNRRRVPSLRFVPRFSVLKPSPTCSMFRTHSAHSAPLPLDEKDSNDLRLAASLAQMFFGNILEGQACWTCFTTYRDFPTDRSGCETRARFDCCTLRSRFIKSFKPFKLYRALVLVIAKFISSYDTFAIDSGLWDMAFYCWYDPYWGKNSLIRLLNIFAAFAHGMGECQKSMIVQRTLRRCFRSLHEYWDDGHPDYPRYAEWFLENSYKCDLLFYFGLAACMKVDCFDFATILNEMVAKRQDILRDLAEDGNFEDILMSLGELQGIELRQALRQVLDLITN
jgi:hypothetical protein